MRVFSSGEGRRIGRPLGPVVRGVRTPSLSQDRTSQIVFGGVPSRAVLPSIRTASPYVLEGEGGVTGPG